ncbi:MAG: hypothetical protein WA364_03690, partial [Candidatus Nitrosopolaris sp.]
MSDHKYIPARSVELHGAEISNDIPYINVYLFNNCTINVLYNELVKVTGSVQQIRVRDKLLPHVFVGLESDGSVINGIDPIEPVEKEESIKITPKWSRLIIDKVIFIPMSKTYEVHNGYATPNGTKKYVD